MKQKSILLNEGFTLPELLVNMVIISAVTVSMFMVFFEMKRHTDLEYNKEEIREFSNLYLDLIAEELRVTQSLNSSTMSIVSGGSRTKINTSNSQIVIDTERGITKNDSTFYIYDPIDSEDGSTKFKIIKFAINEVAPTLGVNLSSEAQDARSASREIEMEVLLYTKEEQSTPYDTLRLTRRVFCPGLLISENNGNS